MEQQESMRRADQAVRVSGARPKTGQEVERVCRGEGLGRAGEVVEGMAASALNRMQREGDGRGEKGRDEVEKKVGKGGLRGGEEDEQREAGTEGRTLWLKRLLEGDEDDLEVEGEAGQEAGRLCYDQGMVARSFEGRMGREEETAGRKWQEVGRGSKGPGEIALRSSEAAKVHYAGLTSPRKDGEGSGNFPGSTSSKGGGVEGKRPIPSLTSPKARGLLGNRPYLGLTSPRGSRILGKRLRSKEEEEENIAGLLRMGRSGGGAGSDSEDREGWGTEDEEARVEELENRKPKGRVYSTFFASRAGRKEGRASQGSQGSITGAERRQERSPENKGKLRDGDAKREEELQPEKGTIAQAFDARAALQRLQEAEAVRRGQTASERRQALRNP